MNPDGNLNYFSDGFQIFWMYIVPETISWPGLETISWPTGAVTNPQSSLSGGTR